MSDYKRNPRGARRARKSLSRKALVVLSLMMVLAVAAVGGTLAWLTATTTPVVNTFTTAGIDITLIETKNPDGQETIVDGVAKPVTNWSAQLVPGKTYTKNPVVSVVRPETDVDIYLFVKFDEVNNTFIDANNEEQKVLLFTSLLDGNNWTPLAGETNVWYRVVGKDDPTISWNLIAADTVQVNPALTKDKMPASSATPKLTYTAYAIQKEGFADAASAWAKVSN